MALRAKYGNDNVIASDIREGNRELMQSGPFEIADATNFNQIEDLVAQYNIDEIYLMAAMLSATAEKFPMKGWELNMNPCHFRDLLLTKWKPKRNSILQPLNPITQIIGKAPISLNLMRQFSSLRLWKGSRFRR